jgi:hypothetical protein
MAISRLWFVGLVMLLAIPAAAQGVAGKWKANVDTPNFGPVPTFFDLKAEGGGKISGTFSNSFIPTPIPISDGTIKGNVASFKLKLQTVTLGYKGPLKGDTLTLTISVIEGTPPGPAGVLTFVATRDK